jgi:hypothetical protein
VVPTKPLPPIPKLKKPLPAIPLSSRYRPIYKVTIKTPQGKEYEYNSWYFKDSTGIKTKQNNKLAIYIDRDLDKKLDVCLISISLRSGDLIGTAKSPKFGDIKIGSVIKVYLGYANVNDENTSLKESDIAFVGIIDEISQSFKSISITAFSMAYKIIFKDADPEKFKGDDWEKNEKSSKQIITTLLEKKLDIDKIDEGLKFTAYTPSGDQSIYDNIKTLADCNGFLFYISKEGKARVHEKSSKAHSFKYGEDILENSITMSKPAYDMVEVKLTYKKDGKDTNVLSSQPIAGSTMAKDKKEETKKLDFGLADDVNTAKKIAENILRNIYVIETGEVKVLGNTRVDLGDELTISFDGSAPGAKELDYMKREKVIITKITHRFGKKSGFITSIEWKKTEKVKPRTTPG